MVKNSSSGAGDVGSIPSSETKIPHASGQLSPWAASKTQCRQINKWINVKNKRLKNEKIHMHTLKKLRGSVTMDERKNRNLEAPGTHSRH